jgi:hypothetical protein
VERVLGEVELPEGVEAVEHLMTGSGPVVLVRGRETVATWATAMGRVVVRDVLALGPGGREGEWVLLIRKETGGLVAEIYGDDGVLRRVRVIDLVGDGDVEGRWMVAGQGDNLWIAVGRVVCCVSERIDFARVEMESEVTALVVSGGGRERRAVVVAAGGGGCRGVVARGASGVVLLMEDGAVLFFD